MTKYRVSYSAETDAFYLEFKGLFVWHTIDRHVAWDNWVRYKRDNKQPYFSRVDARSHFGQLSHIATGEVSRDELNEFIQFVEQQRQDYTYYEVTR